MNKKLHNSVVIILLLIGLLIIKHLFAQGFTSVADFQEYMKTFGTAAPLFLILFQAFQVVVPVVPGYLGCAAGAVAFGPFTGFLCNYIGICLGSIIAFFLGRRYGIHIVLTMFSEDLYLKWSEKIEKSKSYEWFLLITTILPLFPDDFFCYFSGLIKMNAKRFIAIILIGKPWCILAYSLVFGLIH